MNNINEKWKKHCSIITETGFCSIHNKEYSQEVYRHKTRPWGWTQKEFLEWQHPKKDEICPLCRENKASLKYKERIAESMNKHWEDLTEEQRANILQYKEDQQRSEIQKEQLRISNERDYSFMKAGDN